MLIIISSFSGEFLQPMLLSVFAKNTVGAEVIPENRLGEKLGSELGEVVYLVGADSAPRHYGTREQIADILLLKAEGARVTIVSSILFNDLAKKTTEETGCPMLDMSEFGKKIGLELK